MTWILVVVLLAGAAMAAKMIHDRNTLIRCGDQTIANLTNQVDSLEEARATLRREIATSIRRIENEAQEREDDLKRQLESLHVAAMRLCAYGPAIYRRMWLGETVGWSPLMNEAWFKRDSGADWSTDRQSRKPTVVEWLTFVDAICNHAEVCRHEWQDDERRRKEYEGIRRDLWTETLRNLLKPSPGMPSGTVGPDAVKAERDWRLLQFLSCLKEIISLDGAPSSVHPAWSVSAVERELSRASIGPEQLRSMLMDLVRHRNKEYMSILDGFPVDIRLYFLRLTVADPAPAPAE